MKVTQSCLTVCNPMDYRNSPGQNTGVGSHSFLQGIFPAQGLNPGHPHCRWILYQLSHAGSPRTLEWVAILSPLIFPTQELNQSLLHCRWILYQLSYSGSPQFKTPSFIFQDKFFRNREKHRHVFNVGFHPVLVMLLFPLTPRPRADFPITFPMCTLQCFFRLVPDKEHHHMSFHSG